VITQSTTVKARAFRKGVSEVPPTLSGTYCTVVARAIFTKQQPHKASKQSEHLAQGIDFDYYEGPWQDLMLRLKDLTPTKHGNVPSLLDVTAREPNRYFAFRYNGWFEAPEDGVYTFHAPDPMYSGDQPHREAGYDLRIAVDSVEWYPTTRQHAFGTWSIALKKGLHPIEVAYADFRAGKEDMYFPNQAYDAVWQGEKPDLLVSGPGMNRQSIPQQFLWRRK
jgi:hypothetical protein